jgi:hypothetical protein
MTDEGTRFGVDLFSRSLEIHRFEFERFADAEMARLATVNNLIAVDVDLPQREIELVVALDQFIDLLGAQADDVVFQIEVALLRQLVGLFEHLGALGEQQGFASFQTIVFLFEFDVVEFLLLGLVGIE